MITKNTIQFLEDLKENNNRDWFLSQKSSYENYKKNYHALIASILEQLKPKDESLKHLEVKNCTFRINRDIRFSKDKSPYKTHMGIWFSTNQNLKNAPGYYVHIEKGKSFMAGGLYCPEPSDLKKIRREIAFFYDELQEIINHKTFKKEFKELDRDPSQVLKTAPKDFEKDHPAIEFLKLKSVTATQKINDDILFKSDFAETIAQKLLALKPLNEFLNRALHTE